MAAPKIPAFDQLINPLLEALRTLGGSGTVDEIYEKVVEQQRFSDSLLAVIHDPEKGTQTEVAYRLAWARTYLKKYGLLENSARGVWALTAEGGKKQVVDAAEIVRAVRLQNKKSPEESFPVDDPQKEPIGEDAWRQSLYILMTDPTKVSSSAFERLVQRLLRESGFTQVEVTGRTGDGGIDGRGIARIHGLLSFHALFQCKRYSGSVGASEIRDFRGAMVGRSDKGIFITTGTFTPAAIREATRDGAPPIDLIDGTELAEKLKQLGLGVRTEVVERVNIDEEWFTSL